jgi:hypothetical protein
MGRSKVTTELGKNIQKVYGFGLKIAILKFLALSANMLTNFFFFANF